MDARFIQSEQRLIIKLGTLIAIGIVAALVKLLLWARGSHKPLTMEFGE